MIDCVIYRSKFIQLPIVNVLTVLTTATCHDCWCTNRNGSFWYKRQPSDGRHKIRSGDLHWYRPSDNCPVFYKSQSNLWPVGNRTRRWCHHYKRSLILPVPVRHPWSRRFLVLHFPRRPLARQPHNFDHLLVYPTNNGLVNCSQESRCLTFKIRSRISSTIFPDFRTWSDCSTNCRWTQSRTQSLT